MKVYANCTTAHLGHHNALLSNSYNIETIKVFLTGFVSAALSFMGVFYSVRLGAAERRYIYLLTVMGRSLRFRLYVEEKLPIQCVQPLSDVASEHVRWHQLLPHILCK